MDVGAEIDCFIEELECARLVAITERAANDFENQLKSSPPPPSYPLPAPAELEFNTYAQPDFQFGEYNVSLSLGEDLHIMASPTMYNEPQCDVLQPSPLHSQAGVYSQGQYLPNQGPVEDVPTAAASSYPAAAPTHTYNNVPMVTVPQYLNQNLHVVGMLNGQLVYEVPGGGFIPPLYAAPQLNAYKSKKRKRQGQQMDDQPYVKKPPNAFMLFMKEQREKVEAEIVSKGSAAINAVLGQRWKSLSVGEQAQYYKQAQQARLLHTLRHPDWCNSDNYGKKRKRNRRKGQVPTGAEAPASKPVDETQQARRLCVTPVHTAVTEAPRIQTAVMEPLHLRTVQVHLLNTIVTVPVCGVCHLPQMYNISPAACLDAPRAQQEKHSTQFVDITEQLLPNNGAT